MPLPLIPIAVPVIHSAGGWIASTSAGGYLAGTLSTTWAGAFIAGNAGALAASGLAAATAVGGYVIGAGSAAATSVGTTLGIITPTFLGLTPVGWAIAGGAVTVASASVGVAYWKSRRVREAIDGVLDRINEERIKGGLEPFKSSWALLKGLKKEYAAEPAQYDADFNFDEVR